jgi:hypothetical protein
MLVWVKHAIANEMVRPSIPDYALDMHTAEGIAKGRGIRHFYEEGAKLEPEVPNRDLSYHKRIMVLLDKGEME